MCPRWWICQSVHIKSMKWTSDIWIWKAKNGIASSFGFIKEAIRPRFCSANVSSVCNIFAQDSFSSPRISIWDFWIFGFRACKLVRCSCISRVSLREIVCPSNFQIFTLMDCWFPCDLWPLRHLIRWGNMARPKNSQSVFYESVFFKVFLSSTM